MADKQRQFTEFIMTVAEGDHVVVQKIGCRDRRLAIIELGASNLGVGVDEGLLVDAPDQPIAERRGSSRSQSVQDCLQFK